MICHDVQAQLSAFLEKSLDTIRLKGIETHLNSCPACRAEANALSYCIRQVAELPAVEPPPGFAQRVMAHAREIEPRGWQRFMAALRATMPIQAAAVIMIAVLAVLLYQKEPTLTQSSPAQLAELPPALPLPIEQTTTSVADTAHLRAPSRPSAPEAGPETQLAPIAEQDAARARPEQAPDALSTTDRAAAPAAGAEAERRPENRIAAPRRPTIQAQEVATGLRSFRRRTDAFRFGPATGALNQVPFRNPPFAARAERALSPLSEPQADIELIVRRRPFERRDQREDAGSVAPPKRSEADAAIASVAARRAVPAPASSTSSIVEMRWFGVPADRYEQFRKDLAAEAHIDAERSMSGADKEFPSNSPRELLIKVIILPSER